MLHPSDLEIRTLEHNRRVEDVNRHGWLRPIPNCSRRRIRLCIVVARLALRSSVDEETGNPVGLDHSAAGDGAWSVA
jgi:hypothetical protein